MNRGELLSASLNLVSWTAPDGTRYGRDAKGGWIRLGYQTGMTDAHMIEYVKQLESRNDR